MFRCVMNAFEPITRAGGYGSVRFTGVSSVFRRLVIRGALLELLTFGFYRFWLATDIRRHLWSNTEIDGDALEYTGRGKELLLGFLIALVVLLPVFVLYFLLGLAVQRLKAFASLPLYTFLFMFGQFAVYRARRYRLTRTVWRGVRFWMTGSGWSYAWRALLWGLLLIPTLGFTYPWRMAALERYKLGHTFYGNLPGRFEATGWALFKRVWWIWLLGLLPFSALFCGLLAAVVAKRLGLPNTNPKMIGAGLLMFLGIALLVALPFLHAIRKAIEWRWWTEGIRFGEVAVTCTLPSTELIGVYWKLIGMGVLVMFGFSALGGVLAVLVYGVFATTGSIATTAAHLPVAAIVAYGVWYLAMALTFTVLTRIYLVQRVWQRVVNACLLLNPVAAANVTAAGEAASAIGEGLADGLDFAGF
jgi:uncharacterized membrane protein YjgN (DUF898 family)